MEGLGKKHFLIKGPPAGGLQKGSLKQDSQKNLKF